jgi:hypothetical protein
MACCEGTLSNAAEALNVSQPTISISLANLQQVSPIWEDGHRPNDKPVDRAGGRYQHADGYIKAPPLMVAAE